MKMATEVVDQQGKKELALNNNFVFKPLSKYLDENLGEYKSHGLIFKKMLPEDGKYVQRAYSDFKTRSLVVPLMENTPKGIEIKTQRFLESFQTGLGILTVFDEQTEQCVGLAGLTWMDDEKTKAEYNRVLFPEYKSKGIGTRILRALLNLGFQHLKLQYIYGENLSYNIAAQKSAENIGMKSFGNSSLEATIHGGGNFKDTYCTIYRLTKAEYIEVNNSKPCKLSTIQHEGARTIEQARLKTLDLLHELSKKDIRPNAEGKRDIKSGINAIRRIILFKALELKALEPRFDETTAALFVQRQWRKTR